MDIRQTATIAGFATGERDYIRCEFGQFFSTLPCVADGFQIKIWRGGLQAGQPRLPLAAKDLVQRGLMRPDTTQRWPRLLFTKTGLAAPSRMMADPRLADPVKFAHVRQELGIDPMPKTARGHDNICVRFWTGKDRLAKPLICWNGY